MSRCLEVSSEDGATYLIALDDCVIKSNVPLTKLSGDFLVSRKLDAAIKEGSDVFMWKIEDDEFCATFSCEPSLPKVGSPERQGCFFCSSIPSLSVWGPDPGNATQPSPKKLRA